MRQGTRMKSNQAKVLHEILGKPMISHVLDTAASVSEKGVVVVVGVLGQEWGGRGREDDE